jgi:hypothetical protein
LTTHLRGSYTAVRDSGGTANYLDDHRPGGAYDEFDVRLPRGAAGG